MAKCNEYTNDTVEFNARARIIYVNPNIRSRFTMTNNSHMLAPPPPGAHINPRFLRPNIHVNPKFLNFTNACNFQQSQPSQQTQQDIPQMCYADSNTNTKSDLQKFPEASMREQQQVLQTYTMNASKIPKSTTSTENLKFSLPQKIISKTRTKIVRQAINEKTMQQIQLNQLTKKNIRSTEVNTKCTNVAQLTQAKRQVLEALHTLPSLSTNYRLNSSRKIISQTRTKIVREPLPMNVVKQKVTPLEPMLRIGTKKLIRRSLINTKPTLFKKPSNPIIAISARNKYKLDNRPKYVKRSSNFSNLSYARKKSLSTINRWKSMNKQLQFTNINGVFYKVSKRKLERKCVANEAVKPAITAPAHISSKISRNKHQRVLFVKGEKFVMSKNAMSLTRLPCLPTAKFTRLYIGGETYISPNKNDVFVRTGNRSNMTHLNSARQRSMNILVRRTIKSNEPCRIYQRLGKCAAFESGKCRKVHDKRRIAICSKFLRGDCDNEKCLLSHDVCFEKMPTCKFYLQACCIRDNCPYLHKKLTDHTPICADFLHGYCAKAEECEHRHDFLCPFFEVDGVCPNKETCVYCKAKKRRDMKEKALIEKREKISKEKQEKRAEKEQKRSEKLAKQVEEKEEIQLKRKRYFEIMEVDSENEETQKENDEHSSTEENVDDVMVIIPQYGAVLEELPSFIPL